MKKVFWLSLLIIIVLASSASATLTWNYTQGLQSCYPFDTDFNDSLAINNLTVFNQAKINATAKVGSGASWYDGNGDKAETSNFQTILKNDEFTIAGWFNIDELVTDSYTWSFDNGAIGHFMLSGGAQRLLTQGYADNTLSGSKALNIKNWYYIVEVVNRTGDFVTKSQYINGTLDATEATTGNLTFTSAYFDIGEKRYGAGDYNGSVDELAIWNRALNSSELAELYNSTVGVSCAAIIASGVGSSPSNTPPSFTNSLNNNSIQAYSDPFVLSGNFTDVDSGTSLTITWINASNNETLATNSSVAANSIVYLGLSLARKSELKYFFNISDGTDITTTGIFNFTLNDVPSITVSTPANNTLQNDTFTSYSFNLTVSDPDSDTLNCSITFDNVFNQSVSGLTTTAQFNYTSLQKDRLYNVTYSCTDNINTTTTGYYKWNYTDITAPSAVTGLTKVDATASAILFRWTALTTNDLAKYLIYRSNVNIANTTDANYTDTGLSLNTEYSYKVVGADNDNNYDNTVAGTNFGTTGASTDGGGVSSGSKTTTTIQTSSETGSIDVSYIIKTNKLFYHTGEDIEVTAKTFISVIPDKFGFKQDTPINVGYVKAQVLNGDTVYKETVLENTGTGLYQSTIVNDLEQGTYTVRFFINTNKGLITDNKDIEVNQLNALTNFVRNKVTVKPIYVYTFFGAVIILSLIAIVMKK